jgi:hypothetical protein
VSAQSKKSMSWTIVLMLFGVAALFGGAKWLPVLIPGALFVWYGVAAPMLRSGRN